MRDTTLQFSLPPFRGAVRYLILLTLGVWIAILLLYVLDRHNAEQLIAYGELVPAFVLHGFVWQLLTYTFVHVSPMHVIFTLIAVYFIGSAVQERTGSRAFAELYIFSAVLAGVIGVLLALTKKVGGGSAMGAGAAVNAVLMVFFLLHRGVSILLIPFPFRIPVEWVVVAVGGIETAYFVLTGFSLFYLVQLLGLGTGYLWYRFMWRRATVSGVVSDRIGGIRNSYYRWKRERAKKKFQVYMRKHQEDPKQYFDEYGNFRPPDEQDKEKKDRGGSGGWVN
jgi:membrane associated rhomboid family serine protease